VAGNETTRTAMSQGMLALLDRAMQALSGHDHPVDPWRMLVRPGEMVSLKVNTLGGRGISTNVQLVAAICERLQEAGVKANDIVVWDRDARSLQACGMALNPGFSFAISAKALNKTAKEEVVRRHLPELVIVLLFFIPPPDLFARSLMSASLRRIRGHFFSRFLPSLINATRGRKRGHRSREEGQCC